MHSESIKFFLNIFPFMSPSARKTSFSLGFSHCIYLCISFPFSIYLCLFPLTLSLLSLFLSLPLSHFLSLSLIISLSISLTSFLSLSLIISLSLFSVNRKDVSILVAPTQISDAYQDSVTAKESFLYGNSLFKCYNEPLKITDSGIPSNIFDITINDR